MRLAAAFDVVAGFAGLDVVAAVAADVVAAVAGGTAHSGPRLEVHVFASARVVVVVAALVVVGPHVLVVVHGHCLLVVVVVVALVVVGLHVLVVVHGFYLLLVDLLSLSLLLFFFGRFPASAGRTPPSLPVCGGPRGQALTSSLTFLFCIPPSVPPSSSCRCLLWTPSLLLLHPLSSLLLLHKPFSVHMKLVEPLHTHMNMACVLPPFSLSSAGTRQSHWRSSP